MMKTSIVVVASLNGVIGKGGKRPPEMRIGLNSFYLTRRHVVIMGRKTLESTPKRRRDRLLRNCTVVVLSRNPSYQAPGCLVAATFDEALDLAAARSETEVFVLGGAEVFGQAMARAHKIYLALVGIFIRGADAHLLIFPDDAWVRIKEKHHGPNGKNRRDYTTIVLEKKGMS